MSRGWVNEVVDGEEEWVEGYDVLKGVIVGVGVWRFCCLF